MLSELEVVALHPILQLAVTSKLSTVDVIKATASTTNLGPIRGICPTLLAVPSCSITILVKFSHCYHRLHAGL